MTKRSTTKTVKTKRPDKKEEASVQPEFTEEGVKIEKDVFPPVDENAEFVGTAAGQRELRRIKEQQKED